MSNAATAENHGLFGATSAAAGAVLATNKVSTSTTASVVGGDLTVVGNLSVVAIDAAGVFSNVKIVSMSLTTTDSGVHFLGKYVNGDVPADYDTAVAGMTALEFGDTVRVLHNYAKEQWTTANTLPVTINPGDKVKVRPGYLNGGAEGAVYKYVGPLPTLLSPSTQDYSSAEWVLVAGDDDVVYQYMGAGPDLFDLGQTDYTDLRFWKPLAETRIVPQNINFDTSDSRSIAGAIVLNDVRSAVEASITGALVSAAAVTVSAVGGSTIAATADVTAESAGGSTLTGQGASLAAGGVLATNRILSDARAFVEGGTLTTMVGDLTIDAANTSSVTATNLERDDVGSRVGRRHPRLQHDRLEALERPLHGRRRPAR